MGHESMLKLEEVSGFRILMLFWLVYIVPNSVDISFEDFFELFEVTGTVSKIS